MRRTSHLAAALIALLLVLLPSPGHAEKKLALVIGNNDYIFGSKLSNPANDAALMAKTLAGLGFEVLKGVDLKQKEMKGLIRDYLRKLVEQGPDAVGLIYYAGHGIQVAGENYLAPIDADIRSEAEVPLETISASSVFTGLQQVKNKINIVILDACRDNPFRGASASLPKGLARMDAPLGSYLVFATAPGATADDSDGESANSPFTLSLAKHIALPDLTFEDVIKNVGIDVVRASKGEQNPYWSASVFINYFPGGRVSASAQVDPRTPPWAHTAAPPPGAAARDIRLGRFAEKPPIIKTHSVEQPWGWQADTATDGNWGLKTARFVPAWLILRRFRLANPDAPRPAIGIIDGGFADHPDLDAKLWKENSQRIVRNDCSRAHGMHVAGIVGAGFGNGLGIDGAYPGATIDLVPLAETRLGELQGKYNDLPFFDTLSALFADAIDGMSDYVNTRTRRISNVRVVVTGLGYNWMNYDVRPDDLPGAYVQLTSQSDLIRQLASSAKEKLLFVSAAGNADPNRPMDIKWSSPLVWAALVNKQPNIMVVGAHGDSGERTAFSPAGAHVTAPGEGVVGLGKPADGSPGLLSCSGTSSSSAYAAALALILLELDPNLTAAQVAEIIRSSGVATSEPGVKRIDALSAIKQLNAANLDYLVDIDENGTIDTRDLELFKKLWDEVKATGHATAPFDWRTLDLDGDGRIDGKDLGIMRDAWPGGAEPFAAASKVAGLAQ
jgi:hypothetical protein